MDMFIDKLAQKLTAQEMIKANMAADAEEMNKLKGKTKEYAEALEQIKKQGGRQRDRPPGRGEHCQNQ